MFLWSQVHSLSVCQICMGAQPGTLLPPLFPNARRWMWLHPGQDSQDAQPGHPSAPAGPQGELRGALESHLSPEHIFALLQPLTSAPSDPQRGTVSLRSHPSQGLCHSEPTMWKGLHAPQPHAMLHRMAPFLPNSLHTEMNANFQVPQKGKGGVKRRPIRIIHLPESLINAHSEA